jgi:uncharacterized protein YxeA
MKQIIVMAAMIMLGAFIYNLIAGDGENSLINELGKVWKTEIAYRAGVH